MADELHADFVVIGSGICGALTALVLAQRGASVIILEAGPRVGRAQLLANFRNSPRRSDWMSPYPFSPWAPHPVYRPEDNEYLVQAGPYPYPAEYIRMVGGTTWHWAALAWRNVPNDKHMASLYGVGVDWPFDYDELDPYYQWAEELMGVAGADEEHPESPRSKPFPMEAVAEPWAMRRIRERLTGTYDVANNPVARNSRSFDNRPACCGSNNCQPICPVDAQYHGGLSADAAEAAGARLIANASVYKLEHDEQDRIVAAHYYDPEQNSQRVTGTTFVVAANGIETPRLLLMSTSDRFPKSNNLALVILEGIHWTGEGYEIHMPGFSHELSDQQITTLSNYLIDMYGNPDAEVTVDQVQALREGTAVAEGQPDLLLLSRIAMLAAAVAILLLVVWLLLRRRRRRDPLDDA